MVKLKCYILKELRIKTDNSAILFEEISEKKY